MWAAKPGTAAKSISKAMYADDCVKVAFALLKRIGFGSYKCSIKVLLPLRAERAGEMVIRCVSSSVNSCGMGAYSADESSLLRLGVVHASASCEYAAVECSRNKGALGSAIAGMAQSPLGYLETRCDVEYTAPGAKVTS